MWEITGEDNDISFLLVSFTLGLLLAQFYSRNFHLLVSILLGFNAKKDLKY